MKKIRLGCRNKNNNNVSYGNWRENNVENHQLLMDWVEEMNKECHFISHFIDYE